MPQKGGGTQLVIQGFFPSSNMISTFLCPRIFHVEIPDAAVPLGVGFLEWTPYPPPSPLPALPSSGDRDHDVDRSDGERTAQGAPILARRPQGAARDDAVIGEGGRGNWKPWDGA